MSSDDAHAYAFMAGFDGDWRDSWWNEDFLELMARRWRLAEVRTALDLGCGVGHWGQRLMRWMPPDARLTGVDRQPDFLPQARARAESRGLADRCDWLEATAEALPFPDESFDLVTCQTVLMHVADPAPVLAEMRRVLRPGGLIAVAEPDNYATDAAEHSADPHLSAEERQTLLTLLDLCDRGKIALGDGDSSIAGKLPRLFMQAGLRPTVYQSDKCATLLPPYTGHQRTDVDQRLEWIDADISIGGDRDGMRARFIAGGGTDDAFDVAWPLAMRTQGRVGAALRAGTHISAGSFVMLLVSARREG